MARFRSTVMAAVISIVCSTAHAQELGKGALLDALRAGGYVIVMRHASSPRTKPDAASAAAGNVDHERQLDEHGRETAKAMGEAIRRLGIPVGEVLSSPTFRAMQTARLLNLAAPTDVPELGDGGQGMREDTEGTRSAWLRASKLVFWQLRTSAGRASLAEPKKWQPRLSRRPQSRCLNQWQHVARWMYRGYRLA